MKALLVCAALEVLMIVSWAEAAETSKDEAGESWIMLRPITGECPAPDGAAIGSRPGHTPEKAIDISLRGFYGTGEEPIKDYHCRWVTLRGFFKWSEYFHYRGDLYDSVWEYYDRTTSYSGNPRFFIENFKDTISRAELQNRVIDVTGQIYALCANLPEYVDGDPVMFVFGPCHYSQVFLLKDVRVDPSTISPPRRFKGEMNRRSFGDIMPAPRTWDGLAATRAAARDWVATLREGRDAVIARLHGDPSKQDQEERAALADPDNWLTYLTTSPHSPVKRLPSRIPDRAIQTFVEVEDHGNEIKNDWEHPVTCICTVQSCAKSWPLVMGDTYYLQDDYVCVNMRRAEGDKTRWQWRM